MAPDPSCGGRDGEKSGSGRERHSHCDAEGGGAITEFLQGLLPQSVGSRQAASTSPGGSQAPPHTPASESASPSNGLGRVMDLDVGDPWVVGLEASLGGCRAISSSLSSGWLTPPFLENLPQCYFLVYVLGAT